MTVTARIGAPELVSDQAAPETTVNAQAVLFDAFSCPHFINRTTATPPGSPTQGDTYLVAASPTGAWTGQAGNVAIYINTAWSFITPKEGFLFWVDAENTLVVYHSGAWVTVGLSSGAFLQASNNLSDVASVTTSRTNLGLGSVATATLDTDGTLAANSDTSVASQKAVRAYVASKIVGMWDLRGATDCSANPNYPAAVKGDAYVVTVAGKIGGASGATVNAGDVYFATADNAGGTQAAVGASWDVILHTGVAAGGGLLAANNLSDVASISTARANLGLGAAALLATAVAADVQAGTSSTKAVTPAALAGSSAPQVLTDGATISWDMSAGFNAKVTLGGNRTLATPTNPIAGQTYSLNVIQDATGTRIMTWPAAFDWGTTGAPTLTTTASKRDRITLFCTDAATPKFDAFLSGKGFS